MAQCHMDIMSLDIMARTTCHADKMSVASKLAIPSSCEDDHVVSPNTDESHKTYFFHFSKPPPTSSSRDYNK
ncbi:hypothetical protein CHS0354_010951 [Potamilus streckersoni]|uniref:Uncharacterized protein n=1 Tax=Potamilus streckersoni TaxID=2493646 RepID=A0AAE0W0W0_9BIVA|nr:hypothetical protein CHS0354_010951 [Potamilus streckersoni]